MKRFLLLGLIFALALAACAPKPQEPAANFLKVSDGTVEKTYTAEDLKTLGAVQATFKDVTYVGVTLTALLADAGIDSTSLTAVKAMASDGFTANYDSSLYAREDTIVAYARMDGPLGEDEMPFRMVLPNEDGKMNPRQLTEIIAIP
ncbi:MAG: molybdopterin-dependent oxidoreductase [Anaerolineales bacterium]|nr:molybdopterin-dependent oxidoreductase [Anaerolineales bacterium]